MCGKQEGNLDRIMFTRKHKVLPCKHMNPFYIN